MATKADIDKWIADQGGPDAVVWSYDDVEVPDPRGMRNNPDGSENENYDRVFKDKKITVRRETWTNKQTKAAYSGTRVPFANDEFGDIKQSGSAQQANPATQKPTGGHEGPEGTPTGQKDANGQDVYDNTRPRWVIRDAKNQEVYARPLNAQEREQWEKDKNGGKTDAEIAAQTTEPRKSRVNPSDPKRIQEFDPTTGRWVDAGVNAAGVQAEADRNKPGAPTLKPDGKGGTIAVQTMPDGSIKTTALPGVPSDRPQPERVTVGGQVYERDPNTGTYAPARGLPSEGEATAGGPPIPNFVAKGAAQALIDYHTALANDSTKTPPQREKYFQEAHQVAQLAVQQAATEQNERESQRNTEYNVAHSKLTYAQTGMGQALDFVSKLNGTLPIGSDLGGQAFAALLGLQMLQMATTGINNLPRFSAADLTTPQGVQAARSAVTPALQAATAPPAAPSAPTAPNAIGAGGIGGVPPAGRGDPVQTAPAPLPPAKPYAPGPLDNVPAPPAPSVIEPPGRGVTTPNGAPSQVPGEDVPFNDPRAPGFDPNQPRGMTPAGQPDYSVLSNMMQPDQQPPMAPVASPGSDYAVLAPQSDLYEQAANHLPWQMTPDDVARYRAAGIPDRVLLHVPPIEAMA